MNSKTKIQVLKTGKTFDQILQEGNIHVANEHMKKGWDFSNQESDKCIWYFHASETGLDLTMDELAIGMLFFM